MLDQSKAEPGTQQYYHHWQEPEYVDRIAGKQLGDFFRSETHFLEEVAPHIQSILDVGCASGRFNELLRQVCSDFEYTGLDLSLEGIERGRMMYPESEFFHANALEFTTAKTFDLVNATGVCQHEPQFTKLIESMISWSNRYVLFDVKLGKIDEHIVDINRAFCRHEMPMYFIVLSFEQLLTFLRTQPTIASISVYGYPTPLNSVTVVPDALGEIVSAGILLKKGNPDDQTGPNIEVSLPEWLVGRQ